ncbi:sigma 54-interacting transcriptional regulator [Anaerosinus gibii]|uniref:Sigma 54-interacting transcriptional regulator n=1 Tax=Selenobaculum gibii TaxID=3054208 RepID=A0A9Y2AEQ4_9FIRM|nr:sigma-54-dependent transcriptional regulator [Selenobaculum gbiensis]WIW70210.1 sigma 54-interacting transcriptional regulator [Selenobaculum gbiensis]
MKRIEKIHAYIKEKSNLYKFSDLQGRVGIDAGKIAEDLDILRNNVSMELNALYRQGKIIKIMGRPVLFFDRQVLENLLGESLANSTNQVNSIEEILPKHQMKTPFDYLVGADISLKKQVEQAKAAILYPPDGLHTLILGQTGVGKTLFAHMMYEYGKAVHKLPPEAPFITFNCADYYNNPQLLVSHIFGHVKGAFTGADSNKSGLIESADKGILFLDEVHRLPPEGQEMIFYFIDTGTFNKLGETTRHRKAKVLIIGATTEDPESSLTKTFVRRIPNVITIKPLAERTMKEKVDIIKILIAQEVERIQKPVKISVESIKGLIGSISYGNVGQLKSNIKLLCAKAFLNSIDNPNYIEIDFKILPTKIKNGLLTLSADRKALAELNTYINESLFVVPEGEKKPVDSKESQEDFNLYQVVEDKVNLLKGENISDELIKQIVATDVNVYIKSFYHKQNINMSVRERLLKIVDKSLADFAQEINTLVQNRLNREYKERFLYAFSLHLSAFLKRIKDEEELPDIELEGGVSKDSLEFKVAIEIKDKIEEHYHIEVPRNEIEYFALLLVSTMEDEKDEKVVIIVAAHGKSTAASMVEVAQGLFGSNDANLIAIDMPLDINPKDILEKMICKLNELNYQKGVLLLVDMGSLANFGTLIMEKLPVKVKTIDMVSTPLILEAMRKADIVGMDLDSIYDSLVNFKGYDIDFTAPEEKAKEVIITICTSGEGAAVKLKELIEEELDSITNRKVDVIPIGVNQMKSSILDLQTSYKIIAAVGMVKPPLDIPFIPLEKVISGEAKDFLRKILKSDLKTVKNDKNVVVRNLCEESLEKFLTYLNPKKIMSVLIEFQSVLEKESKRKWNNPLRIRLIVHCGCALERMVVQEGLKYQGEIDEVDTLKVERIKKAASVFEKTLNIILSDDEIYYMAQMF